MPLSNLHAQVDRLSCWLNRNIAPLLAALALLYFVATATLAHTRLMWTDEIFTSIIAGLPNRKAIWSALSSGIGPMPPTFYLLTRFCERVLGQNSFALRLPAIAGVLLASMCIFRFVRHRTNSLYGVVAVLGLWITRGYWYAYEGRPYGLVLGFCGLALLCWQAATEGDHRGVALAGLFGACAGAVGSHYGGILLLGPLGIGELIRSILRKKIDLPIWMAFCGTALPLVFYHSLLKSSITSYGAAMVSRPRWTSVPGAYRVLFSDALMPLAAALCCLLLWQAMTDSAVSPLAKKHDSFCIYEVAAVITLLLFPVIGLLQALLVTGQITPRYVLPAVMGFSIIFAFAAFRFWGSDATNGMVIILVLFGSWSYNVWKQYNEAIQGRREVARFISLAHSQPNLPIVVGDGQLFIELVEYCPKDVVSHLLYPADPHFAQNYLGKDTLDFDLLAYNRLTPLNVLEAEAFFQTRTPFLLYWTASTGDWIFLFLRERGAHLELARNPFTAGQLFYVQMR